MLTFIVKKTSPSALHVDNRADAIRAIEERFQEEGGGITFAVEYAVACGEGEPDQDTDEAVEKARQENRKIVADITNDIWNITGYRWRSVPL